MLQVETADNAINMIPVQRQSISEIIMEVQEATDDDGRSYVCNYVSIELCACVCVCVCVLVLGLVIGAVIKPLVVAAIFLVACHLKKKEKKI